MRETAQSFDLSGKRRERSSRRGYRTHGKLEGGAQKSVGTLRNSCFDHLPSPNFTLTSIPISSDPDVSTRRLSRSVYPGHHQRRYHCPHSERTAVTRHCWRHAWSWNGQASGEWVLDTRRRLRGSERLPIARQCFDPCFYSIPPCIATLYPVLLYPYIPV